MLYQKIGFLERKKKGSKTINRDADENMLSNESKGRS
jgi:hypothetical protein